MSITLAAEDLCLSQSAISKQIRALEEQLGVKLLLRGHRSLTFTPEGEKFFHTSNQAIYQLQEAYAALRIDNQLRPVNLTSCTGLAGLWLLPRIGSFQAQYAGVDVKITSNNRILDLRANDLDLSIRYCKLSDAPSGAIRLFEDSICPVAAPSLGVSSLDADCDLSAHTLLEFDDPKYPWLQWHHWLAQQQDVSLKPRGVIRFNQYDQLIQAALEGQGIALGRLPLIHGLIHQGRLRLLSAAASARQTEFAYWLIQADAEPREGVRSLVNWLCEEAQATEACVF